MTSPAHVLLLMQIRALGLPEPLDMVNGTWYNMSVREVSTFCFAYKGPSVCCGTCSFPDRSGKDTTSGRPFVLRTSCQSYPARFAAKTSTPLQGISKPGGVNIAHSPVEISIGQGKAIRDGLETQGIRHANDAGIPSTSSHQQSRMVKANSIAPLNAVTPVSDAFATADSVARSFISHVPGTPEPRARGRIVQPSAAGMQLHLCRIAPVNNAGWNSTPRTAS